MSAYKSGLREGVTRLFFAQMADYAFANPLYGLIVNCRFGFSGQEQLNLLYF
jgi:hypothetical protein